MGPEDSHGRISASFQVSDSCRFNIKVGSAGVEPGPSKHSCLPALCKHQLDHRGKRGRVFRRGGSHQRLVLAKRGWRRRHRQTKEKQALRSSSPLWGTQRLPLIRWSTWRGNFITNLSRAPRSASKRRPLSWGARGAWRVGGGRERGKPLKYDLWRLSCSLFFFLFFTLSGSPVGVNNSEPTEGTCLSPFTPPIFFMHTQTQRDRRTGRRSCLRLSLHPVSLACLRAHTSICFCFYKGCSVLTQQLASNMRLAKQRQAKPKQMKLVFFYLAQHFFRHFVCLNRVHSKIEISPTHFLVRRGSGDIC